MTGLVSLDDAKRHLRIELSVTEFDVDIQSKIDVVTFVVLNHCQLAEVPDAWVVTTAPEGSALISVVNLPDDPSASPPTGRIAIVPGNITLAILDGVAKLFENPEAADVLSPAIQNLLSSMFDPPFA